MLALGGSLSLDQKGLPLLLSKDALCDVMVGHHGVGSARALQARDPKLEPALLAG